MERKYYVLTDSGIDFGDTYINTYVASKERIVEIAREAKRLYACEQYKEFYNYVRDPGGFNYNDPWTDDVLEIIGNIIITKRGETIYELRVGKPNKSEKGEVIQEWKDNGIDADLLAAYAAHVTAKNEALEKFCLWQQEYVWIPVKHGAANMYGQSIEFPLFPEYIGKEYDEVLELCLSRIYDYVAMYGPSYMIKAVQSSLPEWSDDFLPEDRLEYIMQNHTKAINAKKNRVWLNNMLCFPDYMSEAQIKKAIQTAYKDAGKDSKRRMPITGDDRNYYFCGTLFQGQTKDLIVRFWFDFNDQMILTAYPTPESGNKNNGKVCLQR